MGNLECEGQCLRVIADRLADHRAGDPQVPVHNFRALGIEFVNGQEIFRCCRGGRPDQEDDRAQDQKAADDEFVYFHEVPPTRMLLIRVFTVDDYFHMMRLIVTEKWSR
ncbi:MAG: hypothetical protein MZV64_19790 [Ignavibacteriales bacterium]|nr:hypothetical protein [Ignavibacteriales bacterium]